MLNIMNENYYGVDEIAKMLGLTSQTIRKYIKAKKFTAVKMSKYLYVKEKDVNEYLSKVIIK